ncbi:MAG: CBS domain-containing protein [bacterium]
MKSIVDYATFEGLLTVDWNKSVSYALKKMGDLGKSCLLIVNRNGHTIGIITEHDRESPQKLTEFCKERQLETVSIDEAGKMDSKKAAIYMHRNGFHRIVIEGKDRLGIFTSTDFIRMVARGD